MIFLVPGGKKKKRQRKIRVIHGDVSTINCCFNSLWEMSKSMYLTTSGEQRDTTKKCLAAAVVSAA